MGILFGNPGFIPIILVFGALGVLFAIIRILKAFHDRKKRRSPFTANFLRSPGQSLLGKLDDINEELTTYLVMMFVIPNVFYALIISTLYIKQRQLSTGSILVYVVVGFLFVGFLIFKMVQLLNLRRSTRLGYEGEIATGQELNRLMFHGYHVYHDFVADNFNIDHIVVGPAGVFAVETKARAKPTSNNRKDDAKVIYDGRFIHFPTWKETKPLEQAKNQAVWLERWLSSATGEQTQVRPVLTLPGWFVRRTSSEGLPVINPKQFMSIAKPVNGKLLDERRIKRIVHQIDQHCRNIEPKLEDSLGGR